MKIKKGKLAIEESLDDTSIEELKGILDDEALEKIKLKTPDIGPACIQLLLAYSKKIKLECEDPFLNRFFTSINNDANHSCYK